MTASEPLQTDVETQIADWIVGLRWPDVPAAVQAMATTCVVDGFGVALAGSATEVFQRCSAIVAATGEGPCTRWASRARCDLPGAAFLAGVAAHALDFDDTSYAGIVHGTAAVLPAALAVCEQQGQGGEALLEAFVAGVEVIYVLGTATTSRLYEAGHWCTTALGVFGAAAAAAKALGLDRDRTAHALRIATHLSIGLRSAHGTSAKPYLCGMAARLGVESALAARAGLEGAAHAFTRQFGFAEVHNAGVFDDRIAGSLGHIWRLLTPGVAIKLHPVCSAAQAAIEATLDLRRELRGRLDGIEAVHVRATPLVASCLTYKLPLDVAQAQFSMQFAIACALHHGALGLDQLSLECISDPALRRWMALVDLRADPQLVAPEDLPRGPEAASVEIRLRDGSVHRCTVLAATGMPAQPASAEAVEHKFLDCATRVRTPDSAKALLQSLKHLPRVERVRELLNES